VLLYGHTGANMKGYYTVELQGEPVSRQERIRLETQYVQELEKLLGGQEAATALCLAAADNDLKAQALRQACAPAEDALRQAAGLQGVHFALRAWQALDL
jgi:hypothetical protein